MDEAIRETYLENMNELLLKLEEEVLALEAAPRDTDSIDELFRIVHTMKGTSAMFGQQSIADLIHDGENLLDEMREGKIAGIAGFTDTLLKVRDLIGAILLCEGVIPLEIQAEIEVIKKWFRAALKNSHPVIEEVVLPPDQINIYRILFKPNQDIFFSGVKVYPLLKDLVSEGSSAIIAYRDKVPPLDEIEPENCYLYWEIYLKTTRTLNEVRDVFIFVEEKAEIRIDVLMEMAGSEEEDILLGKILMSRKDITEEVLSGGLKEQKKLGEILLEQGAIDSTKLESALFEQEYLKRAQAEEQVKKSLSTMKVRSDKLDKMINLVGELVTLQARLSRTAVTSEDSDLIRLAEDFDRVGSELRNTTMDIRMVPIEVLFSRFKRLVRDLSGQLGKEVDFRIYGADTELDKSVIEKLNDPLVHLIRNTIDHGIESPEERIAAGKERGGVLRLSAEHLGADVVVKVSDDGGGIDREKVLARARSRGLLRDDQILPDELLYSMIFQPGFSTAENISDISGRGVGLNVVKEAIESLSGSIEVVSTPGRGTTFILKIPLTLAIIDGLVIRVDNELYVLPLQFVDRCLELGRGKGDDKASLLNLDGEMVPFVAFRYIFDVGSPEPDLRSAIVLKINDTRVGLIVDSVEGKHQTVIKSLGRLYRNVDGFSGATILGDGTIALILDAPRILHMAEELKKEAELQRR